MEKSMNELTIEHFWDLLGFHPNNEQRKAILHTEGPLFLPAGPGSGKTRVLLWRAFNIIVFQGVSPDRIFLSTFTQKAAKQLEDGLQTLLSFASAELHRPFEINGMYIGTIHSLCQKILQDRRFYSSRNRVRSPILLDEISQFFWLYNGKGYKEVLFPEIAGQDSEGTQAVWGKINGFFGNTSKSKYEAVSRLITFFNRISEEAPVLDDWEKKIRAQGAEETHLCFLWLFGLYRKYKASLNQLPKRSDLSLLQQEALDFLIDADRAGDVFEHVIIDEYQDTNAVQERIMFALAKKSGNICVVGDDDQALYRFRGATVENFVQFPARVKKLLGRDVAKIPLSVNYRSEKDIVKGYSTFMEQIDWAVAETTESYRVNKNIVAFRNNDGAHVFRTHHGKIDETVIEIVDRVQELLAKKIVEDPCQIAFLFSSLTSNAVQTFKKEIESRGLKVYAPRAGSFLQTEEAMAVFGIFALIFGEYKPRFGGQEVQSFKDWLIQATTMAEEITTNDALAMAFISQKKQELKTVRDDAKAIEALIEAKKWNLDTAIQVSMTRDLSGIGTLSHATKSYLSGVALKKAIDKRVAEKNPLSLRYVISSATAIDWTLLDLFYRICGFNFFKKIIDDSSVDEGPLYNLALVGRYVNKYTEEFRSMITANELREKRLVNSFFGSYLLTLYRRKEREFEDDENPFPRGRIPFLTIHQSKGLEFPVVILGAFNKQERISEMDKRLADVIEGKEPLDKQSKFDAMRKFYVAMSRAEKLLILNDASHYVAKDFSEFTKSLPELCTLEMEEIGKVQVKDESLPKSYSFTGDFNFYRQCPMQYQVFKKFDFPPSRAQTMAFGSLVHQTLEDLHEYLISKKEVQNA